MSISNKDDLLGYITEKVAMAGSKGCAITELLVFIRTKSDQFDSLETLWKLLVLDTELEFHTINQAAKQSIPESYAKHHSYQEVITKYGSPLFCTTSLSVQNQYLLQNQKVSIPAKQQTILEMVGSAGPSGIAQCVIAKNLGCKSQTIFHHLKRLQQLHLITKTPSVYRGQYTNTCVHAHYASKVDIEKDNNDISSSNDDLPVSPDGFIRYDATARRMTSLLSQAKDNTMALSDLVRLSGFSNEQQLKWARHFVTKQHRYGFIEKLRATANGKNTMCVRLVRPVSITEQKDSSSHTNNNDNGGVTQADDISSRRQQSREKLTVDLLDAYIASTGDKGCTTKDLYQAFPNHPESTINALVKKSRDAQNSSLVAIKKLHGKSHIYHYFSKTGFLQYQSNHNISEDDPQQPSTSFKRKSIMGPTLTPKRRKEDNDNVNNMTNKSITEDRTIPLPRKNVNLTMDRRRAALLSIVQRDQIRDFNQQLFDEIQDADGSDTNLKMSRKTAQRLVDILENQGMLRQIKVLPDNILNGRKSRSLLLAKGLSESDQIVKEYLEQQRKAIPSVRSSQGHEVLKQVDTTVERYGDRRHYVAASSENFWRYVAKRHGWIDSKWLRAKELHLYLVELILQQQQDDGDHELTLSSGNQTVSLTKMITMFPFDLFRKVIGIHHYDPVVESFVESNNDSNLTLGNISHNITQHLIPHPYQMRRRLQLLLVVLEKLELIQLSSSHSRPRSSVPATLLKVSKRAKVNNIDSCVVHLEGYIRNYSLPDRPILTVKPLTTIRQIKDYWCELQYTCACIYGVESHMSRNSANGVGDLLSSITLSRTWTNSDLLSSEQKRCLDKHVDYSLGKVPTNDWVLYLQLSRETGLLPYRIRSYYINLGIAFSKRNRSSRYDMNQDPSGQWQAGSSVISSGKSRKPLDNTVQLLLQASRDKVCLPSVPHHDQRSSQNVAMRSGIHAIRREVAKNMSQGSPVKDQATDEKVAIQRFSASDKSIFLHAMAIMRHRAGNNKLYWAPILQVLPDKSIKQCVSHWRSLLAISSPSLRHLDSLQLKWATIYNRGIRLKEIKDDRPWDAKTFDLSGYLNYFLTQLQLLGDHEEERSPSSMLPLPAKRIIQFLFDVTPTQVSTNLLEYDNEIVVNSLGNSVKEKSTLPKHTAIAIQLIKMIMVHPEEAFDSHVAFNLLSQCSEKSIEEAYKYLREAGIIVLAKYGDTRRVPGRHFRMSNKFVVTLAGPVSIDLYQSAFDFDQCISNEQSLPANLSDGMMVSLLNLISKRKIVLQNSATQDFREHALSLSYPRPNRKNCQFIEKWTSKHANFQIYIQDASFITTQRQYTQTNNKRHKTETLKAVTSIKAYRYFNEKPLKSNRYTKFVYTALEEFGVHGATSLDLKMRVDEARIEKSEPPINDSDILETLDMLMHHDPPLVAKVGYNELRWVCTQHLGGWMILAATSVTAETAAKKDLTYLLPSLWCDLHGNTNVTMLHTCASAVLGHILRKPGITLDELEANLIKILSKVECQQVLDLLTQKDIIYSHSTLKMEKCSLFSKPVSKSIDPKKTITDMTCHFFTKADFYSRLCTFDN